MAEHELSQSELARRVGVTQTTIRKLVSGAGYGSKHLHRIARELGTTPAYLTGEIDDPDEGAPPPLPEPTVQHVMMPVALPAQPALEAMFRGLLRSMPDLSGDALAHELAKLLPIGLQQLKGPLRYERAAEADVADEAPTHPQGERRERRRA